MFRTAVLAASAALCASGAASAAVVCADAPCREILAMEQAFSARSVEVGAAQAWREYFDDADGHLFGPSGEPAIGGEAIYQAMGGAAEAPATLTWTTDRIWVARSADMATTWGHWTSESKDAARPGRNGRYVTVWRKTPAGRWKVIVDIGNVDPLPAAGS